MITRLFDLTGQPLSWGDLNARNLRWHAGHKCKPRKSRARGPSRSITLTPAGRELLKQLKQ